MTPNTSIDTSHSHVFRSGEDDQGTYQVCQCGYKRYEPVDTSGELDEILDRFEQVRLEVYRQMKQGKLDEVEAFKQRNTLRDETRTAIKQHAAQAVQQAERRVWERIKSRDGFSVNADGCIEIHPDYIDEVLATLSNTKPIPVINKSRGIYVKVNGKLAKPGNTKERNKQDGNN